MKRVLKIIAILATVAFAAVQFIRPELNNPPVNPAESIEATVSIPQDIRSILQRSCSDCHTNATSYPWYSQVSPISWYLSGHITEGRQKLNFSVWNTYSTDEKSKRLDEICEQVDTRAMPLPSYLRLHREAVLTDEQTRLLCDWAAESKQAIEQ